MTPLPAFRVPSHCAFALLMLMMRLLREGGVDPPWIARPRRFSTHRGGSLTPHERRDLRVVPVIHRALYEAADAARRVDQRLLRQLGCALHSEGPKPGRAGGAIGEP